MPTFVTFILGLILIASSLGVILLRNPVHAALSFLLTLLTLACTYFELSAEFIGAMQILVYAGAILVIFIFVIVLFQDAYQYIENYQPITSKMLVTCSIISFLLAIGFLISKIKISLIANLKPLPDNFGTVQSLGRSLYIDFFFPLEAVVLIFLIALVGAVYIGKKGA